MKLIANFIFFKILGWKIVGSFPKDIKKFILIGAPHTSNMDFVIGLLLKIITETNINFVGKKSLFKFPFGFFFRKAGGIPINRKKNERQVDGISKLFNSRKEFILAISPEGTRKKVLKWKTGFYYIAKQANIPIVGITFDFKNKQTEIFPPFYTTDDIDADFKFLKSKYSGVIGKVKANT